MNFVKVLLYRNRHYLPIYWTGNNFDSLVRFSNDEVRQYIDIWRNTILDPELDHEYGMGNEISKEGNSLIVYPFQTWSDKYYNQGHLPENSFICSVNQMIDMLNYWEKMIQNPSEFHQGFIIQEDNKIYFTPLAYNSLLANSYSMALAFDDIEEINRLDTLEGFMWRFCCPNIWQAFKDFLNQDAISEVFVNGRKITKNKKQIMIKNRWRKGTCIVPIETLCRLVEQLIALNKDIPEGMTRRMNLIEKNGELEINHWIVKKGGPGGLP